jgi:hypothetical protein
MEKIRIHVLENEILQIATDEWLKVKENYRQLTNLFRSCKDFYDIYMDGERLTRASFRCKFDINFKYILNAKQLFLKQFKDEISEIR